MNINELINTDANISVVVSVADLKEFALCVVTEAMAAMEEKTEERYLTPDDVAEGYFIRYLLENEVPEGRKEMRCGIWILK